MAHPPELKQRAQEMREQGLLIRVIADKLGVPKPTVTRWLNPELEARGRVRARKRKFTENRVCPDCGGPMGDASTHCRTCYVTSQRYWTRERVIDALHAWADANGRPPVLEEWERSGEGHPAVRTIVAGETSPFASWSEALLAAGFEPRKRRGPKWTARKEKKK